MTPYGYLCAYFCAACLIVGYIRGHGVPGVHMEHCHPSCSFYRAEWNQVYRQIYSADTVAQVKGFERLVVWKVRCPQGIPVGAQCTLDLIQICLKDREVWPQIESGLLPRYHECDLQFMYSMAVLRFLNHLSAVDKNKAQSLYDMAAQLHIPDWVVNIRHDASHSRNLPSLSILREAAHFCLEWIHEHYWKNEAEMTTDWNAGNEPADYSEMIHHLKEIVETWQAIMLYLSAGFTAFTEIPDFKLRKLLIDEKEKYTVKRIGKMIKKLRSRGYALQKSEMAEAQILIISRLKHCMEISGKYGDRHEILVNVLLDGDGFIASPDFLSVFISDFDASSWTYSGLPVNFQNLWKAMLNFLYQNRVIPVLVEKLIHMSGSENESSHRRKMAAVWVKELCKSVDKSKKTVELVQKCEREEYGSKGGKKHKVNSTVKRRLKTKLKTKCTASRIHKQIVQEVEKQNPHLKNVMSLRIQKLPGRFNKLQFVRDTLLKPSASTNIFLPSLMELLDPPLPEDTKEKLIKLVNIYTQELNISNEGNIATDPQIYTVHDLKMMCGMPQNDHDEEMDVAGDLVNSQVDSVSPPVQSHWKRCEGLEEWGKCPFGRLPWQNEGSALQLELPGDTIWQPCKKLDSYSIAEKNLPGFFHEVNWDDVLSKRPWRNRHTYKEHHYRDAAENTVAEISDM